MRRCGENLFTAVLVMFAVPFLLLSMLVWPPAKRAGQPNGWY